MFWAGFDMIKIFECFLSFKIQTNPESGWSEPSLQCVYCLLCKLSTPILQPVCWYPRLDPFAHLCPRSGEEAVATGDEQNYGVHRTAASSQHDNTTSQDHMISQDHMTTWHDNISTWHYKITSQHLNTTSQDHLTTWHHIIIILSHITSKITWKHDNILNVKRSSQDHMKRLHVQRSTSF